MGPLDLSENAYFPRLFSPLRVGQRTLRNRIALSATTTNYGERNRVTDRWIDFLAEGAKGGAGAVITEIIAVDPAALCQASTVTGYEAENEDGFKRTAEAVEGEGACLIAQLWHPGRQQLWSPVASPKGISDQPGCLQLDGSSCHVDRGTAASGRRIRCGRQTVQAMRLRRSRAARRARLSHHTNSLTLVESAHRRLRRLARKPDPVRA